MFGMFPVKNIGMIFAIGGIVDDKKNFKKTVEGKNILINVSGCRTSRWSMVTDVFDSISSVDEGTWFSSIVSEDNISLNVPIHKKYVRTFFTCN